MLRSFIGGHWVAWTLIALMTFVTTTTSTFLVDKMWLASTLRVCLQQFNRNLIRLQRTVRLALHLQVDDSSN